MSTIFLKNQTDPSDVPVFLEDVAGNGYTGSLSGFTVVYRKPGSGVDTSTSLTADGGDGRYKIASFPTDVAGLGWVKITDPGNKILPYWDPVLVWSETPDVQSILSTVGSLSTSVASLATAVATLQTAVTNIQGRLPSALDGSGNMKAAIQSIVANAITSTAIADGAITTSKIVDGLITAAKLSTSALGTQIMYGSRTMRGVLKRLDLIFTGKAAGLNSSTATLYDEDGTTKIVEFAQDVAAGTRLGASTKAGD